MYCLRFDLKRKFVAYVDGELRVGEVERVETHLLDCGACRDRIVRLRDGHAAVRRLRRPTPERDPWQEIAAALAAEDSPVPAASAPVLPRGRLSWATIGWVIAALAITANVCVFAWQTRAWTDPEELERVDPQEFHPVRISNMDRNTEARIVAEGFVSDVRINPEDGDLMFKIVEDLQQPGPFVVCEVIPSIRLDPPAVGSRVRVYGVSRYDAKEHCQWHEIHPVLKIDVMTDYAGAHSSGK